MTTNKAIAMASAALILTACGTGGDAASSGSSSKTSSASSGSSASESPAAGKNGKPDGAAMPNPTGSPDVAIHEDKKYDSVLNLMDADNATKWGEGGCLEMGEVEKGENMYTGQKYETLACWEDATQAQVSGEVGFSEEPCTPDEFLQACYMGNMWWMGAETEYVLKKVLPKGADPTLIYTWDDMQAEMEDY